MNKLLGLLLRGVNINLLLLHDDVLDIRRLLRLVRID